MILCHKYRYVFIRPKKAASSSVESFLAQCTDKYDIVSDKDIDNKDPYYKHMTALEFIEEHPVFWGMYFTFSIIRHPMDRFISEYFYSNRFGDYKNFSEFIRDDHVRGTLNSDMLRTGDHPGFDYIIMYESLLHDLKDVLGWLNIPYENLDLPRLKGDHRQNRDPWYKFISDEDKKYILEEFKDEIEFHKEFGYVI